MSPVRKMRRGAVKPAKRQKEPENVVYIRFGELPFNERSTFSGILQGARNRRTVKDRQKVEKGVSCFETRRQPDGSLLLVTRGSAHKARDQRHTFAYLCKAEQQRTVYEVRGDLVGRGASGEPLLKNCELKEIPLSTPITMGPPEDRAFRLVEAWNRWRYLDATRQGHRTPFGSDNMLEAFVSVAPEEEQAALRSLGWRETA